MKKAFPKATRHLEYVAFFDFQLSTLEGPAYVFVAVDAYSQFAFMLGVEREKNSNTILKNIYFLLENPDFVRYLDESKGFTLVLEDYEVLFDAIGNIIHPANGKILFSKSYNNYLANPVLASMRDSIMRQK